MSAIITVDTHIQSAKLFVENYFNSTHNTYFYTGKPSSWDNETSPDTSISSYDSIYKTLRNRIFHKKLSKSDTILAIKRYDWKEGTVYTQADFDVEYTDIRNWVTPESPFYAMNSEGNVYKCISNNNGSPSTEEPIGEIMSYIHLSDGYIWKFMFNLTQEISDKFLNDMWIPVPDDDNLKSTAHINVENNAINGDIAFIRIDNAGKNYDTTPTYLIDGDGTGLDFTFVMENGSISKVNILNNGSGYTFADINIYGNGTDAKLTPMISPPGGHGSNAVTELGAFYLEVSVDLVANEGGLLPTTGNYRNIGLIADPKNNDGSAITDQKFNTLSQLSFDSATNPFLYTEKIIGETSNAYAYVYHDPGGESKIVDVYMVHGSFTDGETVYGQVTGNSAVYNEATSTINNIDLYEGVLLYKENIIFITRRYIQTEKFTFVIEF